MELVVDVIGELETSIKTAANKNQFLTDSAFYPNGPASTPNAMASTPATASTTNHANSDLTANSNTGVTSVPASGATNPALTPAQSELLDYKAIMAAIQEDNERKAPVPSSKLCFIQHRERGSADDIHRQRNGIMGAVVSYVDDQQPEMPFQAPGLHSVAGHIVFYMPAPNHHR